MLGVSDVMVELLRKSIAADTPRDEFVPIADMGSYYVSKTKQESETYAYMFPVEVDGSELHVYIDLSLELRSDEG